MARFNPQNWQLDSFFIRILLVVCSGLRWFACFSSFSPAIVSNSGGGLPWFVMVCGGLSYSHTRKIPLGAKTIKKNTNSTQNKSETHHVLNNTKLRHF